jgi:DNA-binding transcriptional ArsR family regulator
MTTSEIPKLDGRLAQAVSHPLRVRFLRLLTDRVSLTSVEALKEIEKTGEQVALSEMGYHVRVLEQFGLLEVASSATRERGISFCATDKGELVMLAIGAAPGKT